MVFGELLSIHGLVFLDNNFASIYMYALIGKDKSPKKTVLGQK